ncbi:MAG: sensor histidine kinase [Anaerolineae bacterium]
MVIGLLGGLVVLSIILLMARTLAQFRAVDANLERMEHVSTLTQEISEPRQQIERYLFTGRDYVAAESGALTIRRNVERLAPLIEDYGALNQLDDTAATYLNLIRSYHNVVIAHGASETLAVLLDQIEVTANRLDQEVNSIRQQTTAEAHAYVETLSQQTILLAALVLIAISILFLASMVFIHVIARHVARILGDIQQVAQQITEGHLGAQVNLTGEHDRAILQLGQAFNRMADNLKLALQLESEAVEQNRLQILKLAQQERMTAILEERQRIARELHDSVKQQLFSITLSAGAVFNLMQDAPPLVKTHLEHIKQTGHSAQSEMTVLLQELVSVPLQDKRLEDALLDYLDPLCQTHGLKLIWRTDGTNTLTIAQEHALFRVVQEAASNVVRHSGATVIRVSIRYGLITQVIVEDNGKGFDPHKILPTSNGLSMMRTRLKRVGGHCEIDSGPVTGTRLIIHLDLRRR